MERIVYKKTLDVHKNGVQFMLQGFETADKMSRRIELSLMASGDTIDFPLEQITAVMYVTTPNATEPSINACVIKDNTIIYDVLPITEEGVTQMQVELIGKDLLKGTDSVLPTPKFAVEVTKSNVDDGGATQTPTFTALEDALDRAREVYDKRFLRIELDTDCMFRAFYADGTVYETDILKNLFHNGEALLSQSYARGGTGVRIGEDTDNSMYYSNVSKSASKEAETVREESAEILTEVQKHGVYTAFYVDFEKGTAEYISPSYKFVINKETGKLDAIGEAYEYEDVIKGYVNEWYVKQGSMISDIARHNTLIIENANDIVTLEKKVQNHTNQLSTHATSLSALDEKIERTSGTVNEIRTVSVEAKTTANEAKDKADANEEALSQLNDNYNMLINKQTDLENQLTPVEEMLNGVVDYIIEQGVKDGWEYRIYKSGIAECWTTKSVTGRFEQTWANHCVLMPQLASLKYPFTFIEPPKETVTFIPRPNEFAGWLYTICPNSAENTCRYSVIRPNLLEGERTASYEFYVKGKIDITKI